MRSLLLVAFLDVASLMIGIVALVLSALVGFFFWRVYRAFKGAFAVLPGVLGQVASLTEETNADWGAKGGLNRSANIQAGKMLSLIEHKIFDSGVPFGNLIRKVAEKLELPLDEWIDEMPFGIISLLGNPKFKALTGGLQGGLGALLGQQAQAPVQESKGW